ncbi:MAG: hypothetical protein LIP06_10860 [Tannerellaceae bacterium]|nr:hypothetical protein [Tannerellaceae bacterium]MCC8199047.1 hypothetical protein [Tannerellaceae bacterium]MCD7712086.1 hypothetical protein [Bacillota bacterium]
MVTIRETILSVLPDAPLAIDGLEHETGYRQEATRLNKEARLTGERIPGDKPKYTISKNKHLRKLFIINNQQE